MPNKRKRRKKKRGTRVHRVTVPVKGYRAVRYRKAKRWRFTKRARKYRKRKSIKSKPKKKEISMLRRLRN